jgi:hypothetical protein
VRGGARLRLNTRRGGAFVVEGWANRPNTQLALTVACRDEDGTCSSAQQPGQLCGTRGVGQCADGLYCEFPAPNGDDRPAEACGAADGGGTCSRIAQFCTREYAPVCGCDDVTYGNACEAATVGASIKYNGACDVPPLTCASVLCLEGTVCEMVEVQCIRAPCYPVPECKPL